MSMTLPALRELLGAEWREELRGRRTFSVPDLDAAAQERLDLIFGEGIGAEQAVQRILDDVRERGDEAVQDWTRRIDGVDVDRTRADPDDMAQAWEAQPQELRDAMEVAAERIRTFHAHQVPAGILGTPELGLKPVPLRRAGCYVPGGRAAYPSTVLMSVIPAQVAGVGSIAVATPPGPDGLAHPAVLAAAHLLRVDEVHAMGGAQAIGALAHGTAAVAPVDKVVGPGNIYVTLAKRAVFGIVGIDGLAGPSEVVIIASRGAMAREVAADMVSQLEHDPLAWAVCLTDDGALGAAVARSFEELAGEAQRSGIIAAAAGRHGLLVHCTDMEEALELAEAFAPEHLELQGEDAEALAERVTCAGAVFIGSSSPVPIGDYIAGPNHTLPTGGAARFSGALSVLDFVRWHSVTWLTRNELWRLASAACTLAEAEGLHGHARAIRMRFEEGP